MVSGHCGRFGHVGHERQRRQETTQFTFWEATVTACTFALSHPKPDPRCNLISSNQLETFRQEQLARTRTVGDRDEDLLAMVERSVRHHLEAGTVLQGRELPSVMAAACKALDGAMNIEATALGVAGLLEDLSI